MATIDSENARRFEYFVGASPLEINVVTISVIVLIVLGLIVPVPALRTLFLIFAAGPALWLFLERLRRGRGVLLHDDHLVIEHPYLRRTTRIDYASIHGYVTTRSGGLAIAYQKPVKQANPARDKKARPALMITIRLGDATKLQGTLFSLLMGKPPAVEPIPREVLLRWITRRRIRNIIIGVVVFFLTPLLAIILLEFVYIFLRIGGG